MKHPLGFRGWRLRLHLWTRGGSTAPLAWQIHSHRQANVWFTTRENA